MSLGDQQLPAVSEQDAAAERTGLPLLKSLPARATILTMIAALIVSALLMGVKFFAYWLTGSSGILSDALESIINVIASALALASILLSARPPDETHPYGHGKIEFFSAGFEGALIVFAAAGIFWEGVKQTLRPHTLPDLGSGLLLLVGVSLATLAMGLILVTVGKKTRSLVLEANGKHILTDVYTTVGVLIGLGLVHLTGWFRLDGVVACIVGVNIIFIGVRLVRQSFSGLMDASDPELLGEICDILAAHRKDIWIDVHRLRAWRAGNRVHIDFHLILPRDLPLEDGHREVKELEKIFSDHFYRQSELLVHLDPCLDGECPICGNDPCNLRHEESLGQRLWRREVVTGDAAGADKSLRSERTRTGDSRPMSDREMTR